MDDDSRSGSDDPPAPAKADAFERPADADLIDYRRLIQRALREVPREALRLAAENGLPGAHHFLIDFRTDHDEVEMPAQLFQQFPTSMRIVLQNQFWNLEVDDDAFEVDLRFGGEYAHLRVPFAALTAFVDPAAQIALGFDDGDDAPDDADPAAGPASTESPASGSVVSLDAFRNRDR